MEIRGHLSSYNKLSQFASHSSGKIPRRTRESRSNKEHFSNLCLLCLLLVSSVKASHKLKLRVSWRQWLQEDADIRRGRICGHWTIYHAHSQGLSHTYSQGSLYLHYLYNLWCLLYLLTHLFFMNTPCLICRKA